MSYSEIVIKYDPVNCTCEIDNENWVPDRTCSVKVKTNRRPGKEVYNQWYACSACDHPLNPSDNYCPGCGARIVNGTRL